MEHASIENLLQPNAIAYTGEVDGLRVTLRKATQDDMDYVMGKSPDGESAEIRGLYARLVLVGMANEDGTRMFSRSDYSRIATEIPLERMQALANLIQAKCGFAGQGIDTTAGN